MGTTVWPLVGRSAELGVARAALAGGSGVVIAGPLGVGRTRLADEVLADAARAGARVVRLAVTRAAATIPFGAAAPLLAVAESVGARAGVGATGTLDRSEDTLVEARRAFAVRPDAEPLLVGVDDAHLLDEATATLLDALVEDGRLRLVVTVRTGDPVPVAVARLWESRRWRRIDLAELGADHVRALLPAVLGGEVESATCDRLWQATHGNPLFLRELCRDAVDAGTLALHHGVWAWTAAPFSGPRLHDLVTGRLGRLAGDERRLAGLLALGEPLPLAQVEALAGPQALAALRGRGLVDVEDGDRRLVRLAHPLAADGLRGQLGPLEASDLYAALARSHGAGTGGGAGSDRRVPADADDRLRLAVWSISGNVPAEPGLLAAAAADARHRDDPALSERLARAALGQPPSTGIPVEPPTVPPPCAVSFAAALTLGEALGDLRRPDEAEAVLAPLAAIARDDHGRARVALARLAALRLRPERHDHARALAGATGIRDPVARDVVRAGLAATLSHAGAIEEGGRLAHGLVGGTVDAVRLRALAPAATWLIHAGRAEESLRVAEAVLPRALAHRDEALRARGWTALATVIGLVTAGHVDAADDAVTAAFADPISRRHLDHGMLALLRGRVALSQGRPATARTAFGEAALGLRRSDPVGREAWALSLLAESQALLGDGAAARATLAERPTWGQSRRFDADIARAELWVTVAEGEVAKAAGRAVELADDAEASGHLGFALLFLDAAVRLGATGLAERVVAVATRVEGPFASIQASLAPALTAGDGAGLDAAADRLAALGIDLHAAEAATHAARAHRRAGAARHARASADRAARLAARCEGAWTPALAGGSALDDLTPREREVVLLAGRGLSSRAIAEHFTVSVRTIDNQLGRAYRKLGITSRADLSALLRNAPGP